MEEANMGGRERKEERMEKKKHELSVIEGWDILKRQKEDAKELDLTYLSFVLLHIRKITTFNNYSCNIFKIYPWIGLLSEEGSLRLLDTEQFKDIQRIISETTHGPHASESLHALVVFSRISN